MNPQTDQQRMLSDAARQFAEREHTPARLRACRDRNPDFDREVWTRIADLGWLGVLVPEKDGGLGGGFGDMAQLVYAWGRACAPEPLVATGVLALRALAHADGPARDRLLGNLVAGRKVVAVASDSAVRESAGVLDGTLRLVVPAHADEFLVPAGAKLLRVAAGASGVTITHQRRADGSHAARITLTGVKTAPEDLVATSAAPLERALDEARILAAVEMCGMMKAMLDMTLDYLRTRVQFDKPIGSFQALQHRAVDLFIAEQLARDVAQSACAALDAGGVPVNALALLACRAKARAGESLNLIAREAVQMHGAIGFTDEYALGLYVNRALVLSAWLGNAAALRARYARLAPPLEALGATPQSCASPAQEATPPSASRSPQQGARAA